MLRKKVFLIGLRYPHHARHSGYEAFGRYVGRHKKPPVGFRWTLGEWGWKLNGQIVKRTGHGWYSLGALLTELATLGSMLVHRKRLYHLTYGDSDLWLLRKANRLTGNTVVATFHQPTDLLRELDIVDRVARHLDAVTLVAECQRPFFEEFLPPDKVFVVPHGVDSAFFHPPDVPARTQTCITVGSHQRDFDTFADAARLVWEQRPDVRFVAIGTQDDNNALPESLLQDERIELLQGVSDERLRRELQTAGVGLFAFRDATANNAVLEAAACGLPMIATNIGGMREYLGGGAGRLVPSRDPAAMAAAAVEMLEDQTAARELGIAGRQRAEQLDFRHVAERMADVYRRILGISEGDDSDAARTGDEGPAGRHLAGTETANS